MKKILIAVCTLAATLAAGAAHASDVHWSIGIHAPHVGTVISNAPQRHRHHHVAPPVMYYPAPAVVYHHPPTVVYQPEPVYQPAPVVVYRGGHRHPGHWRGHGRHFHDDHHRGGGHGRHRH
jgi:hypothetical protein